MAVCKVCFRHCNIGEGALGFCGARICREGEITADNYGRITSLALDPIEKKPLNRFHPGSLVVSVGSYGCNLRCPFCQNSEISWSDEALRLRDKAEYLAPEDLADIAARYRNRGNIGLAFCQNGKVVQYTLYSHYLELGPNYGFAALENLQVQLPRSLRAGTYQVYPCVVPTSGTFENYCGIVRTCGLLPQYYTCTIQSNKGTFVRSDDRLGVLEASEWTIADRTVTANRTQRFTGKVTNKSDYTVSGRYTLQLISPEGDTATVQNKTVLTLAPEESGQLTFDYNFRKKGVWTGKLYIAHQGFEGYLETDLTPVEGSEFPIYVGVAVVGIEEIVATDLTPVPTYNTMGQRVAEDRIEKSELYIRDGKKAIAF